MFSRAKKQSEPVFKYSLGAKVKDRITSFEGIITARSDWMNGCIRYLVTSQTRKPDGEVVEIWLDEPQVDFIEQAFEGNLWPVNEETGEKPKVGGPRNDPARF